MELLNAVARGLVDLLLFPFRALPPIVGLAAVSLGTAVTVLLIFRKSSDQARLGAEKRQLHAAIYEIRLFSHDLRAILRAQGEILRRNLRYLRLSLLPMLCVAILLFPILAQLHFHYAYRSPQPHETVLVKAHLHERVANAPLHSSSRSGGPAVSLQVPDGIVVQTPAVWIPATNEVFWRIAPAATGSFDLQVRLDGESFSKRLEVSDEIRRLSPVRAGEGLVTRLLYPAERPLPAGAPFTQIEILLAERRIGLPGLELHWAIVFFVLSALFALALRRPLRVTL